MGHILGHIVDVGICMPVFQFNMMELDGEFVGVVRGFLFKEHLLTYDPTYNVVEWVPVHGTVGDLSPIEDSSAHKLSNITLLDKMDGVP